MRVAVGRRVRRWLPSRELARDCEVETLGEAQLLSQEGRATFESERPHGDVPPPTGSTDDVIDTRASVIEEHFAEVVASRHLHQRSDIYPRLVHGDQQHAQAVVPLRVPFGAAEGEDPVGKLRLARPHLLPVDVPRMAVHDRTGRDRGQVRAAPGSLKPWHQ